MDAQAASAQGGPAIDERLSRELDATFAYRVITMNEGANHDALPKPAGAHDQNIFAVHFFDIATNLEPLGKIPTDRDAPYSKVMITLLVAGNILGELNSQALYAPYLKSFRLLSRELLNCVKSINEPYDYDKLVKLYELWSVKNCYDQYKIALLAEIGAFNAYFVTQKGGFDTSSLLDFGENLFPADLSTKVPEAVFDAREAARCMAYENSTAAGFHLFRVLESVLRAYYSHKTGGRPVPKVRNISVYVNAMMQGKKGDPKKLMIIKQISDLFRNPLIHQDTVLSIDDAIATHGIVRSAVTQMLSSFACSAANYS